MRTTILTIGALLLGAAALLSAVRDRTDRPVPAEAATDVGEL